MNFIQISLKANSCTFANFWSIWTLMGFTQTSPEVNFNSFYHFGADWTIVGFHQTLLDDNFDILLTIFEPSETVNHKFYWNLMMIKVFEMVNNFFKWKFSWILLIFLLERFLSENLPNRSRQLTKLIFFRRVKISVENEMVAYR